VLHEKDIRRLTEQPLHLIAIFPEAGRHEGHGETGSFETKRHALAFALELDSRREEIARFTTPVLECARLTNSLWMANALPMSEPF
jgi:hypothetical protein